MSRLPRLSTVQSADSHRKIANTVNQLIGMVGGNTMSIGLFVDAGGLSIPTGTDMVQTSGYAAVGKGHALYVADAAVDSAYVTAHPQAAFISLNGRGFRLSHDQLFRPTMFGAVGNGTTVDYPAFAAAHDYIGFLANAGFGFSLGGRMLHCGADVYNFGDNTWDITYPLVVMGEGSGIPAGGNTVFKWTSNVTGLRLQKEDTTGATGTQADAGHRGAAVIDGVYLEGAYISGAESEAHGIHAKTTCDIRNCFVTAFAGDGVRLTAEPVGDPGYGNVNTSFVERVWCDGNRNGFYASSQNANAINFIGCSAVGNRQWNVWDRSFLRNTWTGLHTDGGGGRNANSDGVAVPVSKVHYNGHYYVCVPGQESWASTNAPSGSTANNQGWTYWYDGAVAPDYGAPAWFNGILCRGGGNIFCENQSTFVGPYAESNAISLFHPSSLVVGPLIVWAYMWFANTVQYGNLVRVPFVETDAGGYKFRAPATFYSNVEINGLGRVTDELRVYSSTGYFGLNFWQTDTSGNPTTLNGSITYTLSVSEYNSEAGADHVFKSGGTEKFRVSATSGAVSVGGAQMLAGTRSTRGAADLAAVVACLDHHGLWG